MIEIMGGKKKEIVLSFPDKFWDGEQTQEFVNV